MATETSTLEQRLARWSTRLQNLTVSPLTRDYPEQSSVENARRAIEAYENLPLSSDAKNGLEKLSSLNAGATGFITLLTAYVVLVSRLTGDDDIALGTSTEDDGRPFALRVQISWTESFADLQSKIVKIFNEFASDVVPLRSLRNHLQTTSESENAPTLFRFAAFEAPAASQEFPANTLETTDLVVNVAVKDLSSAELGAFYNQRLFASSRIATILSQLAQLLQNAAASPTSAIGKIEFMTPREKSLLPDPTCDLDWSGYRGAIHDIFSRNAEAHPDRLCVVETESSSSSCRQFTYRQIHEASNVLGHHLVAAGIQRGDVVMAYAHRGVDLVVAVMGILKAGATFSVIDPAYPPMRQNIYLDVARPRALVIIEKATQEAGPLDKLVTDFISDTLELKTTVPALALRDDGTLDGGLVNGEDVLAPQTPLKQQNVGVVVGPDSTPTLSFTSGSEGRPKGVRGRHFSLAYYFPWMAERFGLTENDKFTMLSGIAHDPIQRDMFTPLFLGAQLLVPSKEDIQNEKLAEWMRKYQATVTHLTPAMGQILVGGATAVFPDLHHAFFVGDILIKRDCRSLQSLAPNVNIVNMYGTTETQRAVSYYEVPSYSAKGGFLDTLKDVIPAGRGMLNVQVLVVNRHDRNLLCATGEVGEIYVRAGGLAEGYLGSPELTAKKFITNWFVDPQVWVEQDNARAGNEPWREFYVGPKDRLYRSGDLGRYTPDGLVECSGRADDQVKIRGFRIELGEIDTHLSRHPLVRENTTLVRRDKYEEPTLVSYVVPQMAQWESFLKEKGITDDTTGEGMVGLLRRFHPLRDDVRDYLRTKLAAYAVPTVIVPLRRMPLNPNGKIDKPALPFPDTEELSAAAPRRKSSVLEKLSETEEALAQIWAKLISTVSARMIGPDDSFFDLGGHSILAQQMIFEIRRRWRNIDVSMSIIFRSPTLKAFASEIDRMLAAQSITLGGSESSEKDAAGGPAAHNEANKEYSLDAKKLVQEVPATFPKATAPLLQQNTTTVFLTGATGFLGAYILRELLSRQNPSVKVVALVRAKTSEQAFERIRATCQAYGSWSDSWAEWIECLQGSLGEPLLGLSQQKWDELKNDVDVVIHNGAMVHWVYPYANLKPANVIGTIDTLKLCAEGKSKHYAYVSSTSVLDTDYYVNESDRIVGAGGAGISEADDLEGSSSGLGTGYGQSKWVAEYLVREAGRRGLRGSIVRPGYVVGDSKSGITNTDDFLVRFIKGCVQLSARPNINNNINMVPVDHVASIVIASAFHPPCEPLSVAHVTGHPRLRFNQFLGALETYGYNVNQIDYVPWTRLLEQYVQEHMSDNKSQHALMPLYHFVTADLPSNTKAPEMDDTNAAKALAADAAWAGRDLSSGAGVNEEIMGAYISYLVSIGFLPPPDGKGNKELPASSLSEAQKSVLAAIGGRGSSN